MREHLATRLKRVVLSLVVYGVAIAVCQSREFPPVQTVAISVIAAVLLPSWTIESPKRSRRVPAHIKSAVLQRDLRSEPYDPKRHHLDHIVPYSMGGDTSIENLRVLPKEANLKKRAKMPRVKDFL